MELTLEDFKVMYGDPQIGTEAFNGYNRILKADDPLLSPTTGNYKTHYGGLLYFQMNTDSNLFGAFPKDRWGGPNQEDGWRAVTALPTTKGYGIASNGVVPDSIKVTLADMYTTPKTHVTPFEESQLSMRMADRHQAVGWSALVDAMKITHGYYLANTVLGAGAALAPVNVAYPLDRVVSNRAEVVLTLDYKGGTFDGASPDMYGIDRHSAAGWYDSQCMLNGATMRSLTLDLIYQLQQLCATASGMWPGSQGNWAFLTGYDTARVISSLLQAHQRFVEIKLDMATVNGISSYKGQSGGMMINTFNNVPILPCLGITTQTGGISPIYLVNLDHLRLWMDIPTVYFELGVLQNPLYTRKFGQEGIFQTNFETWCNWFACHGKLREIKA